MKEKTICSGQSEVDREINSIVAPLATHLEKLIQSVKDFSERSSNRSTEGNAIFERLGSLGQLFHSCFGMDSYELNLCYFYPNAR